MHLLKEQPDIESQTPRSESCFGSTSSALIPTPKPTSTICVARCLGLSRRGNTTTSTLRICGDYVGEDPLFRGVVVDHSEQSRFVRIVGTEITP